MFELRDLAVSYDGVVALAPTALTIARGETLVLLGPSGSGKSTLLRALAGLAPFAGTLRFDGAPVSDWRAVRRRLGYVIQDGGLFPHLTARGNVTLMARELNWPEARISARVETLSALVGLDMAQLGRFPSELSGGQRQRVAMMRALMLDPAVLLLDEPLSALDAQVREHLQLELRRLQKQFGITTLMVTHDQEEAVVMADRIAVMQRGRIEQFGTPSEIYRRPATPFVADFIGQSNWLPFTRISGSQVASGSLQFEIQPEEEERAHGRLFCRPEAIDLFPAQDAANRLLARVVDRLYLGNRYRLALHADALPGQTLLADVSDEAHQRLSPAPQAELWIALPRQALQVFA